MLILLIDDDDNLIKTLSRILQDNGHWVCTATNDKVAIQWAFQSGPFDIVICDWDLGLNSTLNGGEIIEQIRPLAGAKRYIIMSGLDRDVPDDVEFYSKMNVIEMLDSI